MPDNFKEVLSVNLNSLHARVVAEHEREVLRLHHTIEGLKRKIHSEIQCASSKDQDAEADASDSSEESESQVTSHEVAVHAQSSESEIRCMELVNCVDQSWNVPGVASTGSRRKSTACVPMTKRLSNGLQEAFGVVTGRSPRRHSEPLGLTSLNQELNNQSSALSASSQKPSIEEAAEDGLESSFKLAPAWQSGAKSSGYNKKNHFLSKPTTSSLYFTSGDSDNSSVTSLRISGFLSIIGGPVAGHEGGHDETRLSRYMKRFMIQPSSMKHVCWNMVGLLLIFYDAVIVPLDIFNPPETVFFDVMLVFVTVFWTLDIVGNFFTGYMRADGSVTMKPASIAFRYSLSWLPFDAFMVACNWMATCLTHNSGKGGVQGLNAWRTLTLCRVLRMMRLLKAPELEGFISEHIRSETARLVVSIARLIVLLVLVAHFIACSWYGVGYYVASQGHTSSWVARYNLEQKGIWANYAFSIHWSLVQFTGEQIIPLESLVERTFAIVIFLFTFLFSTIFVSSITTLMTRLQIIASKQSSQLCLLRRYLHDNGISTSLAVRVLRNAQLAMRTNQRMVAEHSVELLQEISESLQVELHSEVHFPTLAYHPFFKGYNAVNPAGMKKLCHQAVSITWLSTHDVIFSECETPEKPAMLFVVKGELLYQKDGSRDCPKLSRGTWACELLLWIVVVQHSGTMSVLSESSVLSLEAEKFQRIVRHFPTHHARDYAKGFLREISGMSKDNVTDVPDVDVELICEAIFPEMYSVFTARNSIGSAWSMASTIKSPKIGG